MKIEELSKSEDEENDRLNQKNISSNTAPIINLVSDGDENTDDKNPEQIRNGKIRSESVESSNDFIVLEKSQSKHKSADKSDDNSNVQNLSSNLPPIFSLIGDEEENVEESK